MSERRMGAMRVLQGALLCGALLLPSAAWAQAKTSKAPAGKASTEVADPEAKGTEATGGESSTGGAREKPLSGAKGAATVKGNVKVEESKEGVKSYTFGAQELEGRLKSPQILYFLRRVRAQFDPSGLGHRSFMRELADTRRHRAVR
jgi:hypothetical protein